MHMMGPVRDEMSALDEAIRDEYGHQVTRENVRAIIAGYQAAMPEARKSRPTEDNRRTAEEDTERQAAAANAMLSTRPSGTRRTPCLPRSWLKRQAALRRSLWPSTAWTTPTR